MGNMFYICGITNLHFGLFFVICNIISNSLSFTILMGKYWLFLLILNKAFPGLKKMNNTNIRARKIFFPYFCLNIIKKERKNSIGELLRENFIPNIWEMYLRPFKRPFILLFDIFSRLSKSFSLETFRRSRSIDKLSFKSATKITIRNVLMDTTNFLA